MTECDFTFGHYGEALEKALELGYSFTNFRDYEKNKNEEKLILLRHDVDVSLPGALELAEIEAGLGIKSSFFIRLHSPRYNPMRWRNMRILRRIQDSGHEIGLHFEVVDLANVLGEDALSLLARDLNVLENIADNKVVSVSEHRSFSSESKHDFLGDEKPLGIENSAYESRFMKNFEYLTDSLRKWRNGCFCRHLGKKPRLYLLAHPVHWIEGSVMEY